MASSEYGTFGEVKSRLDEILDAVSDESLPLDDALTLYEEAVSLGLRASDLLEENIEAHEAEQAEAAFDAEPSAAQGEAAAESAAPAQGEGAGGAAEPADATGAAAAAAGADAADAAGAAE
ncbi:MAG TPA: exodeoxyribonuclease VII small subunit [Candidatus Aphodovivens avistercoris]|nr:exodeoxyribonuclease VII small subunit [Candidatus Aphodovivens avistercoris]